jgi:hypothetical protein
MSQVWPFESFLQLDLSYSFPTQILKANPFLVSSKMFLTDTPTQP